MFRRLIENMDRNVLSLLEAFNVVAGYNQTWEFLCYLFLKPTHHNDGYGKLFLLKELATLNCMDYDITYCITIFLPVHPLLKRCVVSPFISNPTSHKNEHRNAMENP